MRKQIAYIPQREAIDWDFPLTVKELVLMGRYGRLGPFRRPRDADKEAADYYLNLVDLTPFKDRQINQLSGGQKQRAFLARALIQEVDLYFLDEPFSGIDVASEVVMVHWLKKLVAQGKTVFVVHHDLNSVESLFSWVILLNLRLVACGDVMHTFNSHYLKQAYGKSFDLLDVAGKLARDKQLGII